MHHLFCINLFYISEIMTKQKSGGMSESIYQLTSLLNSEDIQLQVNTSNSEDVSDVDWK